MLILKCYTVRLVLPLDLPVYEIVPVEKNLHVIFENTSNILNVDLRVLVNDKGQSVWGEGLWKVGLWVSANEDGSGERISYVNEVAYVILIIIILILVCLLSLHCVNACSRLQVLT